MPVSIVPELTQGKPLGPLAGVGTDKASQETLNLLIHSLGLTVSLRMVCSAHVKDSSSSLDQNLPKIAGEDRVPV